jgi:anti-sigma factor (TIGR02949 family)
MISCREVMEQLWDYLDGELPPERMQALADHLAVCRRCYPQYRFQFAFLEAVARERARVPGPSEDLREQVRVLVTSHREG